MRALLATWPAAGSIHEASDGQDAVQAVAEWHPDLVVLDARMPGMDGVLATLTIKTRWPEIKVVVLSMYGEYRAPAMAAGADAFVSKGQPPEELLNTLSNIADKHKFSSAWRLTGWSAE